MPKDRAPSLTSKDHEHDYVLRTGMSWRDLPERYGPHPGRFFTAYMYYPLAI